jgi:hypothetical protein
MNGALLRWAQEVQNHMCMKAPQSVRGAERQRLEKAQKPIQATVAIAIRTGMAGA